MAFRDGKIKSRALAHFRFHPDPASVAFDDAFADRQPDPGPGVFLARVQPLEYDENALRILRFDADAVVPDAELPCAVPLGGRDFDPHRLRSGKLQGVPDQVLEKLAELHRIGLQFRQIAASNLGPFLFDGEPEVVERLPDDLADIEPLEGPSLRPDPGILQKVLNEPLHPLRAVHRVADEFMGSLVELILVTARQQLGVAGHHPKRFLKIVGNHVGELLQFLVGAMQLVQDALQRFLRFDPLGHIRQNAHKMNELSRGGIAHGRDLDFVPEWGAVLAVIADHGLAVAHLAGGVANDGDGLLIALRPLQKPAVASHGLLFGIAGHPFKSGVHVDNRVVRLARVGNDHSADHGGDGPVAQDEGFLDFLEVGDVGPQRDHAPVAHPVIADSNPAPIELLVKFATIRLAEESDALRHPLLHVVHTVDETAPAHEFVENVVERDPRLDHLGADAEHGAECLVANDEPFVRPKHHETGIERLDGVHQTGAGTVEFLGAFFHSQLQFVMGAAQPVLGFVEFGDAPRESLGHLVECLAYFAKLAAPQRAADREMPRAQRARHSRKMPRRMHDGIAPKHPRRKHGQRSDPRHHEELVAGLFTEWRVSLFSGNPDAHIESSYPRRIDAADRIDTLLFVHPHRFHNAFGRVGQNRVARQTGLGRFADPLVRVGVADQEDIVGADHGHRSAGRERHPGPEFAHRLQVNAQVHDPRHDPRLVENGARHMERRFAGDLPLNEIAENEALPRHGTFKKSAVSQVGRLANGRGAANDVPVGIQGPHYREHRVFFQQFLE